MKHRVVVTGLGAISPVGIGVDQFWKSIISGKSGVDYITLFDTTDYDVKIGAEVKDFDPAQYLDRKEIKRTDRYVQFAVAASKMALADADLEINATNANEIGVVIGSGIGGIKTFEDQARVLIEKGPDELVLSLSR